MSRNAENDAAYARGMANALGETLRYLERYGPSDLPDWLLRRQRGWMAAAGQEASVIPPAKGHDA